MISAKYITQKRGFYPFFLVIFTGLVASALLYDYSPYRLSGEQQAVANLIERLIGNQSCLFNISIDPTISSNDIDTFKLLKNEKSPQVIIIGSSGVAATWGFHFYLKHYCNSHISWDYDQINLPQPLPNIDAIVRANEIFRFYQNVCTWSYSYVWWDWARWEREIDWMALNGINIALAFNGQEAIWYKIYKKLNMKEADIDKHFTGPAFLAWGRMGNMRGFGGPLNEDWHKKSVILQQKILARMRQLGITPVLPGFAGQVPQTFKELFPNSTFLPFTKWVNFPNDYCCPYLLEPTDPLFENIGSLYLRELSAAFGTDHVYLCDTFNEMRPQSNDEQFLRNISKSIFQAMRSVDPKAIWMLQGWMFSSDLFWTESRAKAFLTAVPQNSIIVLDLHAEMNPQYKRLSSFFGQPFIWCMLHNFGGTLGLHGSVESINNNVFLARTFENSTMIGTGITPEGINQNYVMYELMMEMGYRREPVNLVDWFTNYARRRYGVENKEAANAWILLLKSTYNYTLTQVLHGHYILCKRPGLRLRPQIWYDPNDVFTAWNELLKASNELRDSKNYLHDLVDVTRQALQVLFEQVYEKLERAFEERELRQFQTETENLLNLLTDMEKILATNEKFLLGNWIKAARDYGIAPLDKNLYEMNARNQITLWGPNGEILDYATKQWSGVVSNYYIPRWKYFINAANESLTNNKGFNETEFRINIFKHIEQPFSLDLSTFPTEPKGDTIQIADEINKQWRKLFSSLTLEKVMRDPEFKQVLLIPSLV